MAFSDLANIGTLVATTLGATDPLVSGPKWGIVTGVLGSWLPSNSIVAPGAMVAAGAAVSGLGVITITGSEAELGPLIAAALVAPTVPAPADMIKTWIAISKRIILGFNTNIKPNGVGYVASAGGGPVTLASKLVPTAAFLGPALSTIPPAEGGASDPLGIAGFLTLGTLLEQQFCLLGTAFSLGFTSPPGGGPLAGASVLL